MCACGGAAAHSLSAALWWRGGLATPLRHPGFIKGRGQPERFRRRGMSALEKMFAVTPQKEGWRSHGASGDQLCSWQERS